MEKVRDILSAIEDFAPFETAEDWDNSGLVIGSRCAPSRKLGVTLDITDESLEEAISHGCDCVVSHHPFPFEPVRRLDMDTPRGRKLRKIILSGLSIVAAHTNWDVSPCGVNAVLAERLGLIGAGPLPREPGNHENIWEGATGKLPSPLEPEQAAEYLKQSLSLSWIRMFGSRKKIERVALCGGSGGPFWESALSSGADLYLTSDMKYHDVQDAVENGLIVASADHGEIEGLSISRLAKEIRKRTKVEVIELNSRFETGKTFV